MVANANEVFAQKVGLVALSHAEMDERFVEVMIQLLHPLSTAQVELLVGGHALSRKIDLLKAMAPEAGLSLDEQVSSQTTLTSLLSTAKKLDQERDKVLHSYYEQNESHRKRRFRSRRKNNEEDFVEI